MREEIYEGILYNPNNELSCVSSDVVKFLTQNKTKRKFTNTLMDLSVRDLHNNMIKPSDNGGSESVVDSVTREVMISDRTLRLFIPPQVRKMTTRLH